MSAAAGGSMQTKNKKLGVKLPSRKARSLSLSLSLCCPPSLFRFIYYSFIRHQDVLGMSQRTDQNRVSPISSVLRYSPGPRRQLAREPRGSDYHG